MNNSPENGLFAKLSAVKSSLSDIYNKISSVRISKKLIIIGFVAVIFVLAMFSAVILIDESRSETDISTTDSREIDPAVLGNAELAPVEGSFVFVLTNNEKTSIHSVVKIDFSSEEERFVYEFIPANIQTNINGAVSDFSGHLASGGTNLLLTALRQHTGTEFIRYAVADESSLMHLFQLLGDTTITIDERVSSDHNGVNFIIEEGEQLLTPDMMLKYYLYLLKDTGTNGERIIGILIDSLERLVSGTDDTKLESDFCTVLGYFDTDISAFDYSGNKELLKAIPSMNLKEKAQPAVTE